MRTKEKFRKKRDLLLWRSQNLLKEYFILLHLLGRNNKANINLQKNNLYVNISNIVWNSLSFLSSWLTVERYIVIESVFDFKLYFLCSLLKRVTSFKFIACIFWVWFPNFTWVWLQSSYCYQQAILSTCQIKLKEN